MDGSEVAIIAIIFGTSSGVVITAIKAWMSRQEAKDRARTIAPSGMEDRLQRIEQAVDAISVEVERVSEGQRFTTRLLSERLGQSEAHAIAPSERGVNDAR